MYTLVATMELELQVLLRQPGIHQIQLSEKAIANIMSNNDVLYQWSILSANCEPEEEQALLQMIVEM